jgi:hypothetical protein
MNPKPKKRVEIEKDGAIYGGVISFTQERKGMKKFGAYFGMMQFKLPDDKYKKYIEFLKAGEKNKAQKIFDLYAVSSI